MPCISVQPEASSLGKLAPGHGPPPRLANELCESQLGLICLCHPKCLTLVVGIPLGSLHELVCSVPLCEPHSCLSMGPDVLGRSVE